MTPTSISNLAADVAALQAFIAPCRVYSVIPGIGLPISVAGIRNSDISAPSVAAWIAAQPTDRPIVLDLEPPSQPGGYGAGSAGAALVVSCAAAVAQIKAARPAQLFAGIFDFPSYGWFDVGAPNIAQWTAEQAPLVAPAYQQVDWVTAWGYWPYAPPAQVTDAANYTPERYLSELMLDLGIAGQFGKRRLVFVCPNYTQQGGQLQASEMELIVTAIAETPSCDICVWDAPQNYAPDLTTSGIQWLRTVLQPDGTLKL